MIRSRAYFFSGPSGGSGKLFETGNFPTQATFQDLLDSVTLKSETGDRASETQAGLVLLNSDANSKLRSGSGVVQPDQLPVLEVDGTELITPGASSYQGIKVTAIAASTRLNYQIDFDPTSLSAKATPLGTDYFVLVDTEDSNTPKKVLLSTLLSNGLWQETSGVLSPVNSDSLDMGVNGVTASTYLLTSAANTYINPLQYTANNGSNLRITGGAGQDPSSAKVGGNLYLNAGVGANGGGYGTIFLGWDDANTPGVISLRGTPHAGYEFTVHDDSYFDGVVYIKPTAPPGGGVTINTAPVYGSDGNIYYQSFKDFMTSILGGTAPSEDSVLLYQGGAYSSILIGSTKDAFLHTNASTGALEMAVLDMTGRITNLAWSNMAALADSTIPQINDSGVIESSGVPKSVLPYIANLTSDAQAQIAAIQKNTTTSILPITTATIFIAATLPDVLYIDTTAGSVPATLPLISTLADGRTIKIHQYGRNTAQISCNAGDGGFTDAVNSLGATINVGGAGDTIELRADQATKIWYVV